MVDPWFELKGDKSVIVLIKKKHASKARAPSGCPLYPTMNEKNPIRSCDAK